MAATRCSPACCARHVAPCVRGRKQLCCRRLGDLHVRGRVFRARRSQAAFRQAKQLIAVTISDSVTEISVEVRPARATASHAALACMLRTACGGAACERHMRLLSREPRDGTQPSSVAVCRTQLTQLLFSMLQRALCVLCSLAMPSASFLDTVR